MRHPAPRQFAGVLLGSLAAMSLQGCQRIGMITDWAPANPSPTVYLDDSELTSRVRAALRLSPVANSINISVESHQGVVRLSGMAADPTQIDLAVFVAQTVPGVSSVDSSIFSTGIPPNLVTGKNYTPSPAALRTQRLLGHAPHSEAAPPEKPPSAPAPAVVSLSHPLTLESGQSADNPPKPSRWVSLAHSVLGIRSIQDELLVKQ